MAELLTAAQMRAIEQAAIAGGSVTGLELMERAGQGVVEAVFEEWPELDETAHRAVVLCGPGNNGGDGFVIARLLKGWGWAVEVFFYGEAEKLPPDARVNYERWCALGEVRAIEAAHEGAQAALVVDAMFGTGASRPIPIDCAGAFWGAAKRGRPKVVAVDCPSGWDCDAGGYIFPPLAEDLTTDAFMRVFKDEVQARLLRCDLCVTFHAPKRGHYLEEVGRARPVVVDIGLKGFCPVVLPPRNGADTTQLIAAGVEEDVRGIRVWMRTYGYGFSGGMAHKYERGHALVLGGGPGRGGAARLAARTALRAGAGLVTLAVPHAALAENAAQLTAVMLCEMEDAAALETILEDERLGALCLGPGLGVGAKTRALVGMALADGGAKPRPTVLDADALTSFADDPAALFALCNDSVVLTPHEGEFARLFPDLSEEARRTSGMSKIDAVAQAAARANAVVLLKGPATVIAAPGGQTTVHAALYDRRAPWLGTAGAGDVLAGLITGLLAAPQAPFSVMRRVEIAAYLHVEAARAFGPGLIAEDLPEMLPKVFADLGL